MLSGLCNVMMDPARFQGTDSDGSSRVAVQQTFAPDANARHPRIASEVSTQSVLLGDSSDVVVPIQPMYARTCGRCLVLCATVPHCGSLLLVLQGVLGVLRTTPWAHPHQQQEQKAENPAGHHTHRRQRAHAT